LEGKLVQGGYFSINVSIRISHIALKKFTLFCMHSLNTLPGISKKAGNTSTAGPSTTTIQLSKEHKRATMVATQQYITERMSPSAI